MYFLSERTIFIYQTFYSLKMYLFCAGINASHPFFFNPLLLSGNE